MIDVRFSEGFGTEIAESMLFQNLVFDVIESQTVMPFVIQPFIL